MPAGAPELLQALALRLLTQLWQRSGRGFPVVELALLGFSSQHREPSLLLRTARAASVRDACRHDSGRGLGLVVAIQVLPAVRAGPFETCAAPNSQSGCCVANPDSKPKLVVMVDILIAAFSCSGGVS